MFIMFNVTFICILMFSILGIYLELSYPLIIIPSISFIFIFLYVIGKNQGYIEREMELLENEERNKRSNR